MPFEIAEKFHTKADIFFQNLDKKYGRWGTAVIIALIVLIISALYITPRATIGHHVKNYCDLAAAPFNFEAGNPMQYRILAPLLGYITFLRNDYFPWLPRIFCFLFSIAVFLFYRKKLNSTTEAFVFVSLLCFSNVYLFSLHTAAYTDIIYFFFIFFCYVFLQRPLLLGLFFALAVFTHESTLFLLVPLFVHAVWNDKNISFSKLILNVLSFVLPLILYILYRKLVSSYTVIMYDYNYYFSMSNIKYSLKTIFTNIPLGYFYVFKLFWFFPAYYFIYTLAKKNFKEAIIITLYLSFTLLQLVIAWDVTRLLCLCFPVMLFCAEKVRCLWGSEKFVKFSFVLIAFNFLVPQYYIWVDGPQPMMPFIFHLSFQVLKQF